MKAAFQIRDLAYRVSPSFSLDIPSLDIPEGRLTALLGRSASGKSTLLSLLGRVEGSYFEQPAELSGRIELCVGGAPVELLGLSERALLRQQIRGWRVGFVFQREGLFSGMSARENVSWALKVQGIEGADGAALEALEAVQLSPSRAVATLSGGERKRLALARALALKPPVLLLDEPLTGLDPEALAGLHKLLSSLRDPGHTQVMVTHQREDIEALADHLVFMDGGRVVLSGPKAELAPELARFFAGDVPRVGG